MVCYFIIVRLAPMNGEPVNNIIPTRKSLLAIKSVGRINQTAVTFRVHFTKTHNNLNITYMIVVVVQNKLS